MDSMMYLWPGLRALGQSLGSPLLRHGHKLKFILLSFAIAKFSKILFQQNTKSQICIKGQINDDKNCVQRDLLGPTTLKFFDKLSYEN